MHGTSVEPAELTAVETPSGAATTMNATDMSITFTASNPGTYYVPYTITQGSIPSTGLARVEVQAVAGDAAKPIAANDVALLGADNTAIVEPLANDVDPMGGVLSVTSVTADAQSGIKTGVVSNKRVYITARQVPTEPVRISYTVANAAGSSTGVIVLQPPALTTSNSVPKAENITTQVRTEGIVSVDVLDHVTYSDGTTVSLQNDLQYDKNTFKGLVFVSGDTVRYQATRQTGSFPVTYTVKDNLGNAASATITINVHQKDASNKAAPTPSDVEAQVAAGQKVQIPITLTGIDADGDDVQLLGLGNKAPELAVSARWAPRIWCMRRMPIRPERTPSPTPWRIGPVRGPPRRCVWACSNPEPIRVCTRATTRSRCVRTPRPPCRWRRTTFPGTILI